MKILNVHGLAIKRSLRAEEGSPDLAGWLPSPAQSNQPSAQSMPTYRLKNGMAKMHVTPSGEPCDAKKKALLTLILGRRSLQRPQATFM